MTRTSLNAEVSAAVNTASRRLADAARTGIPCAPVRDLVGETDIRQAYAVQNRNIEKLLAAGARIVGRKIGLTSPAVQEQLGVDQPDFGALLDDMDVTGLREVPIDRLLQPRVEAEVAFVLAADLAEPDLHLKEVRSAVDYAIAALEIVDSRVAKWDIRITDTVADNASSALYVLGTQRVPLTEFAPGDVAMRMYVDEVQVSEGCGAACLGDPLNALLWLARTCCAYGSPLRAGEVILSGALGPMVPVVPGATVRTEIVPLGSVTATFSTVGNKQ